MRSRRDPLLLAGAAAPIVFWLTLAVCGRLLGGYSHVSDQVSDLGAAGTPTRALFAVGLLICAVLSVILVVGLYRTCRRAGMSSLPALIILAYSFSTAGAAIFPLPHPLHGTLGLPAILILLSPPLAAVCWRWAPGAGRLDGLVRILRRWFPR